MTKNTWKLFSVILNLFFKITDLFVLIYKQVFQYFKMVSSEKQLIPPTYGRCF